MATGILRKRSCRRFWPAVHQTRRIYEPFIDAKVPVDEVPQYLAGLRESMGLFWILPPRRKMRGDNQPGVARLAEDLEHRDLAGCGPLLYVRKAQRRARPDGGFYTVWTRSKSIASRYEYLCRRQTNYCASESDGTWSKTKVRVGHRHTLSAANTHVASLPPCRKHRDTATQKSAAPGARCPVSAANPHRKIDPYLASALAAASHAMESLVGDVHRSAQSFRQREVGAGKGDIAPYWAALDRIKAEKAALAKTSDGRAGDTIGVSSQEARLQPAIPGRRTLEDELELPRVGRAIREIEDEGGRVASGQEHGGHSRGKASTSPFATPFFPM
ncbi:hypothetical protein C8R47DRAFT_308716 [Mycena vitilis]|nr:hypothetical protein C8R47DRAFT_308716 [Mycena vitilis]